jgi:hypothetical protein
MYPKQQYSRGLFAYRNLEPFESIVDIADRCVKNGDPPCRDDLVRSVLLELVEDAPCLALVATRGSKVRQSKGRA